MYPLDGGSVKGFIIIGLDLLGDATDAGALEPGQPLSTSFASLMVVSSTSQSRL